MNNKSELLKNYIIKKYGSIPKFIKKEKFCPRQLETVLQKNGIFHEIGAAVKLCAFLNIDAERLFCRAEIVETDKTDKSGNDAKKDPADNLPLNDRIKEKYAKLTEADRKKVLDYANYIFENGNGGM